MNVQRPLATSHPMCTPIVILVSSDPSLTQPISELVSAVKPLRLEIVSSIDTAFHRVLDPEVAMILVHLGTERGVSEVVELVRSISLAKRSVVTLAVSEQYNAGQALALLRAGVADYLPRPLDLGRLSYLIEVLSIRARRFGSAIKNSPVVDQAVQLQNDSHSFIYLPSSKMGQVMSQILRVARQDTTILLGGETGTGKSCLAGLIHRNSNRANKPFLTINCGALSANLIESEMFGHVKGAFTGADSDRVGKFSEVAGGTLFLDEVDSLPLSLQAKLLRAVEERVFEPVGSNKSQKMQARIIAACNQPLEKEIAAGRFRSDLYYRLNVVSFTVPPLRDRASVVPHLAKSFLKDFSDRTGTPTLSISPAALAALEGYDWPGNIRELRNVIERAVALCTGTSVQSDDLPEHLQALVRVPDPKSSATQATVSAPALVSSTTSLASSKEDAERTRIMQALKRNDNNRLQAAAELGISRMTLYNKLRKYGPLLSAS